MSEKKRLIREYVGAVKSWRVCEWVVSATQARSGARWDAVVSAEKASGHVRKARRAALNAGASSTELKAALEGGK